MNSGNADKLLHCRFCPLGELVLNILQKYLFREWLWTFLAVTIVLLIVMIGMALGELLNDISGGRVPSGLLWTMIGLSMPDVLNTIIPLSIFIAIIWGLGRIYRDQEMAVMRSSGFRWQMMLRPLFNLLLPVVAALLLNSLFLMPVATSAVQQKLLEAFRNAAEWGLQTGTFHVLKGGDLVLYVEAVEKDGRTLNNVFIQLREEEREQVWSSEKGYYWLDKNTGNRYLTLENGQVTEGGADTLDFRIMQFSRNDLKLPEQEERVKEEAVESRKSSRILFSGSLEDAVEIRWRLAPAISAVILGLLAIPLSHSAPKDSRGGRAILGLLAYAVYANTLYMARNGLLKGEIPLGLGLWWVHALVLLTALIWMRRQGRVVGKG